MIKVGIIGATGYAGSELVRILLGHKDVEIKWYGSRSYIDKKYASIYQNFFQLVDANCMDDNMEVLADQVDVIFTATPQGLCASLVNEEILSKVISHNPQPLLTQALATISVISSLLSNRTLKVFLSRCLRRTTPGIARISSSSGGLSSFTIKVSGFT